MLTDQQVRDLLHLAADTVDVGNAPMPVPTPRRSWPLAAAASVVLVVGGVSVLVQSEDETLRPAPPPTAADGRTRVASMSAFVSGDWDRVTRTPFTSLSHNGSSIRLGFRFSFPEDRVLSSPSLHVGGKKAADGYLWALDGVDHEGEDLFDPLPLAAGTSVLYEAAIEPDCRDPEFRPTIVLSLSTTVAGGGRLIERLVPENPESFDNALTLACGADLAFQAGGGSIGDNGEARVAFLVNNPGSLPVTVEIPALKQDGASWKAATVTVPAGSYSMIEIVGSGVTCGHNQAVPWTTHRILVDAQHTDAPVTGSWDC